MIKGLGTDLVDVVRMEEKVLRPSFIKAAFTKLEIAYCHTKKHPAQHYGARFAAKEAYMKAVGTGWGDHAEFKEIEVVRNTDGKPEISLSGNTLEYFNKLGYTQILVSLSHTKTTAMATVIIE